MPLGLRLLRLLATVVLAAGLGFIFKMGGARAVEIADAARKQAQEAAQALGSDSFSERFNAKTRLMQLGRASIEPLEYAVKSEDPEVRLRAMELLIALRGRGFLGIGLQESTDDEIVNLDSDFSEPGDVETETAHTVEPPVVIANQVVSFRSPQYTGYGITKPFPAEAAGMQPGDKILTINERPIHGVKDLMREIITIGPARMAILVIERGGQRLRLPVLLTRNPMTMRNNDFGGYQMVRENPPPVDLETGVDGFAPDKRAEAPPPQAFQAGGGIRIIGGGQVIINGQVRGVVQRPIAIQAAPAAAPNAQAAEMEKLKKDVENLRRKLNPAPAAGAQAAQAPAAAGNPMKDLKADVEALRKKIASGDKNIKADVEDLEKKLQATQKK